MTPREYIEEEQRRKEKIELMAKCWLPKGNKKLKNSLKEMEPFKLCQEDVPLIIKLVENPKYDIGLFAGNVDLFTHDCIHVLLGRGLLPKDEAFVIGYTMGSTRKMKRWRRNLFMLCAKYLYPEGYSFGEDERFVFNMGVMTGSLCESDLSKVDFNNYLDLSISQIRGILKVDKGLLNHCYAIEKRSFDSAESQRL